jgi:hypothetical protein
MGAAIGNAFGAATARRHSICPTSEVDFCAASMAAPMSTRTRRRAVLADGEQQARPRHLGK